MLKTFKSNFFVSFLIILPSVLYSQKSDDHWGGDIEPPPTPIDGYVFPFAVVALLMMAIFLYKVNLKNSTK